MSMQDISDIDYVALANTKAKGKRPAYLEDTSQDRMLSILMALVGEVSVVRERLDTIERLLNSKDVISRADIEAFVPDRGAQYERGLMAREFIARVLRSVQQEREALEEIEPPLEEVVNTLREI
jgi:hypothetical protein